MPVPVDDWQETFLRRGHAYSGIPCVLCIYLARTERAACALWAGEVSESMTARYRSGRLPLHAPYLFTLGQPEQRSGGSQDMAPMLHNRQLDLVWLTDDDHPCPSRFDRGFERSPITCATNYAASHSALDFRRSSDFRAAWPQVSEPRGVRT
jgi:hypothetical protein